MADVGAVMLRLLCSERYQNGTSMPRSVPKDVWSTFGTSGKWKTAYHGMELCFTTHVAGI